MNVEISAVELSDVDSIFIHTLKNTKPANDIIYSYNVQSDSSFSSDNNSHGHFEHQLVL